MNAARIVVDYRKTRGHWPDILVCDPTCVHHVAFELGALTQVYPDIPSISICHDKGLPSGAYMACSLIEFLTFSPENLQAYEVKFHPEALN